MRTHPTQPNRMRTAIWFLSCCIALLMTGFGIIVPVFPQRLEMLGLGAETLALMEGAFGLGMFLLSTPMGMLADRLGRKPVVLISLAGFIVTNPVLCTITHPLLFILIRFIEGAMISGLMPASMAMVGDSVPKEHQSRCLGLLLTAQTAGVAVGPGIGGFLFQLWGFAAPFYISAALAGIASFLALLMLPETLSEQVHGPARQRVASKRWTDKGEHGDSPCISAWLWVFLPFLVLDCGRAFIYPFVLPQYPFFFWQVLGYNAPQFGVVVSVYGLALTVFPILLGRLSEACSKKLLIALGNLLYAALNGAMLFLHQYALFVGAAIVSGMGNALLIPALGIIYLDRTTLYNRSQVMGIRGTAMSLGTFLGPIAQALASPWITARTTFTIGLLLSLVLTLLALIAVKH